MLPDFPGLKKEIRLLMMADLRRATAMHAPIISQIPHHKMHEGGRTELIRADGSRADIEPQEHMSEATVDLKVLREGRLRDVYDHLVSVYRDMARKKEWSAIKTLHEVTEETGNVLDAQGRMFGPDLIIELLERTQIDFDKKGNPLWPTLVVGADLHDKLASEPNPFETEPYKTKFSNLVERKRIEWDDRESGRKLVG